CELIDYPMAECVGIEYRDERSVFTMIAGGFLVLLIAAIAYLLAAMWDDLTPGLQIPVGAMAVGAGVGLRWTFMSRRHKFVFEMKDGIKLKWRSRSGDFKYKVGQANKIVTFAKEAGLLRSKA
ncbi:MAG: hypothetical protein JKY56_09840, partial [Kofleriaceae bacterium]|nr:hypothetical protein [Kofleriaceae bacterium]